jgi:hypothetical protein
VNKLKKITEKDLSTRYIIAEINNSLDEDYLFGCEFEFYPKSGVKIDEIITKLYEYSKTDLLVNEISVPSCKDSSKCMQLKPDNSLDDNGLEISIPISSYNSLLDYIKKINNLIFQFGYTNDDTGLHIHISTRKKDGINFNFYKFALLCNEAKLLDSWYSRNGYCLNVMEVINYNNKKDAKRLKKKKGRVWNLELIEKNRIEIRTIGGKDYHLKTDKIIKEVENFRDIFIETIKKDNKEFVELKKRHLEMVKRATDAQKIGFIEIFKEYF